MAGATVPSKKRKGEEVKILPPPRPCVSTALALIVTQPSEIVRFEAMTGSVSLSSVSGGMSDVVFESDPPRAVKRMRLTDPDPAKGAQITREIEFTTRLRPHPHLTHLRQVRIPAGTTSAVPSLVSDTASCDLYEWVCPTHQKVSDDPHLPLFHDRFLVWSLYQLIKGVEELHRHQVVHRDLKPANILVYSNHDSNCHDAVLLVVADLGHATLAGSIMTKGASDTIGSHIFQPPEVLTLEVARLSYRQYDLLAKADTAVDMWAVGMIFLFMLLRGHPIEVQDQRHISLVTSDVLACSVPRLGSAKKAYQPACALAPHLRQRLKRRYPTFPVDGLDLLERLLDQSPVTRICASDAIKHPFFTRLHPKVARNVQRCFPVPQTRQHLQPRFASPPTQQLHAARQQALRQIMTHAPDLIPRVEQVLFVSKCMQILDDCFPQHPLPVQPAVIWASCLLGVSSIKKQVAHMLMGPDRTWARMLHCHVQNPNFLCLAQEVKSLLPTLTPAQTDLAVLILLYVTQDTELWTRYSQTQLLLLCQAAILVESRTELDAEAATLLSSVLDSHDIKWMDCFGVEWQRHLVMLQKNCGV